MEFSYYAIFQYDVDGICISFPDVPSALTCADKEEEGINYAREVLELALHGLPEEKVPFSSPIEQIILRENQKMFLIATEIAIRNGKLFSPRVKEL